MNFSWLYKLLATIPRNRLSWFAQKMTSMTTSFIILSIETLSENSAKFIVSWHDISAALSSSLLLFLVVVVVALFVFDGLHFDLVLGLTHAFLAFLYFL